MPASIAATRNNSSRVIPFQFDRLTSASELVGSTTVKSDGFLTPLYEIWCRGEHNAEPLLSRTFGHTPGSILQLKRDCCRFG
jgi:hypothetical protein